VLSTRKDDDLNLVRLPLPYDGGFMELFYKSFNLVRAFLEADARVPLPVALPDAEDRFVTNELEQRARFPVLAVTRVIRDMSQRDLLDERPVEEAKPTAELSETEGLEDEPSGASDEDLISLTPRPLE
jgi:hypothetical protein